MALQGLRLSPNRHKTKANQPPHDSSLGLMVLRGTTQPLNRHKTKASPAHEAELA